MRSAGNYCIVKTCNAVPPILAAHTNLLLMLGVFLASDLVHAVPSVNKGIFIHFQDEGCGSSMTAPIRSYCSVCSAIYKRSERGFLGRISRHVYRMYSVAYRAHADEF